MVVSFRIPFYPRFVISFSYSSADRRNMSLKSSVYLREDDMDGDRLLVLLPALFESEFSDLDVDLDREYIGPGDIDRARDDDPSPLPLGGGTDVRGDAENDEYDADNASIGLSLSSTPFL